MDELQQSARMEVKIGADPMLQAQLSELGESMRDLLHGGVSGPACNSSKQGTYIGSHAPSLQQADAADFFSIFTTGVSRRKEMASISSMPTPSSMSRSCHQTSTPRSMSSSFNNETTPLHMQPMMDQRADDVVLEHILQRLERDEISVGDALGSLESEIQSTCPPPLASTRGQSPAASVCSRSSTQWSKRWSRRSPSEAHSDEADIDGRVSSTPRNARKADVHSQQPFPQPCQRCRILTLQVKALGQALAGLAARTFNWSAGLSMAKRRSLADLMLEYATPCAHIDSDVLALCRELQRAHWEELPATGFNAIKASAEAAVGKPVDHVGNEALAQACCAERPHSAAGTPLQESWPRIPEHASASSRVLEQHQQTSSRSVAVSKEEASVFEDDLSVPVALPSSCAFPSQKFLFSSLSPAAKICTDEVEADDDPMDTLDEVVHQCPVMPDAEKAMCPHADLSERCEAAFDVAAGDGVLRRPLRVYSSAS